MNYRDVMDGAKQSYLQDCTATECPPDRPASESLAGIASRIDGFVALATNIADRVDGPQPANGVNGAEKTIGDNCIRHSIYRAERDLARLGYALDRLSSLI